MRTCECVCVCGGGLEWEGSDRARLLLLRLRFDKPFFQCVFIEFQIIDLLTLFIYLFILIHGVLATQPPNVLVALVVPQG